MTSTLHSHQCADHPENKINKAILDLKDTTEQMDVRGIYGTFRHIATEYTLFSLAHGTFSRTDHISMPQIKS